MFPARRRRLHLVCGCTAARNRTPVLPRLPGECEEGDHETVQGEDTDTAADDEAQRRLRAAHAAGLPTMLLWREHIPADSPWWDDKGTAGREIPAVRDTAAGRSLGSSTRVMRSQCPTLVTLRRDRDGACTISCFSAKSSSTRIVRNL